MRRIQTSSGWSKRLVAAASLILALSALTAASAQGAEMVVPHTATHTVSPKAVPPLAQPGDPSTGPDAGLPAPPSSESQQIADGQTLSASQATASASPGSPSNDVGHDVPRGSDLGRPEDYLNSLEYGQQYLQTQFDDLAAQLTFGLSDDPVSDLLTLISLGDTLGTVEELIDHPPEVAVREVLGYSGVSDQVCGGGSFESINGDLEDPNNGIAFC
jgi:hypothetical protein